VEILGLPFKFFR